MKNLEKDKNIEIADIKYLIRKDNNIINDITALYKKVFSSHPWEEQYICANALVTGINGKPKCNAIYRDEQCNKFDIVGKPSEIINDCRDNYKYRKGIYLLSDAAKNNNMCIDCNEPLIIKEFYPEYVDHVRLFNEAVREEGFIGKIAIVNNETVGFSWGYSLPSVKTMTVRFDLLTNIFSEKGLHQKNTFYAAETGIASEYRGKSIGTLLSSARLIEAH